MDRDVEAELIRLRAELDSLRRNQDHGQALPGALALVALLIAVLALLIPLTGH